MGAHVSSVRIIPSKREEEHRAKIRRAAEWLESPPPIWLTRVLSDFSFEVASQHSIDQISPKKSEMFEEVSGAQEMVAGVIDFLRSPFGPGYVAVHSPETSEEFQRGLIEPLEKLLRGVTPAYRSLLDESGNVKSGRGKACLPGTLLAKYVCAAIIAEAADFLQENGLSTPSKTNMFKAATELWTAWFSLKGWGNDRLSSWKSYFGAVEDVRLLALRGEVRRHLQIEMAHSTPAGK